MQGEGLSPSPLLSTHPQLKMVSFSLEEQQVPRMARQKERKSQKCPLRSIVFGGFFLGGSVMPVIFLSPLSATSPMKSPQADAETCLCSNTSGKRKVITLWVSGSTAKLLLGSLDPFCCVGVSLWLFKSRTPCPTYRSRTTFF